MIKPTVVVTKLAPRIGLRERHQNPSVIERTLLSQHSGMDIESKPANTRKRRKLRSGGKKNSKQSNKQSTKLSSSSGDNNILSLN